ncbi:hypothetical protein KOR42_14280 [Thalassoglobus neptunius]|uniref:Uncharacterized protein n=2 Tax=Thalassoglobus neptunius TaxID=1938619 RepID=A0A5C5X5M5_9PLAN|nr:hypothetical protein KOR42_14280 [Thalassoglobus neptunius]
MQEHASHHNLRDLVAILADGVRRHRRLSKRCDRSVLRACGDGELRRQEWRRDRGGCGEKHVPALSSRCSGRDKIDDGPIPASLLLLMQKKSPLSAVLITGQSEYFGGEFEKPNHACRTGRADNPKALSL